MPVMRSRPAMIRRSPRRPEAALLLINGRIRAGTVRDARGECTGRGTAITGIKRSGNTTRNLRYHLRHCAARGSPAWSVQTNHETTMAINTQHIKDATEQQMSPYRIQNISSSLNSLNMGDLSVIF